MTVTKRNVSPLMAETPYIPHGTGLDLTHSIDTSLYSVTGGIPPFVTSGLSPSSLFQFSPLAPGPRRESKGRKHLFEIWRATTHKVNTHQQKATPPNQLFDRIGP
ncbi:hypothetical protein GDO86_015662 [Hymenochirus boettgeri]|uniref:Uncharacterized protein n=1 Tax=Hymenochirus boettgeri TaxID=247094 RepID=A0A8T2K282_9PIPI|nr:hypothetical protein GDO86_015662 [Hymenochirus boettgeri]